MAAGGGSTAVVPLDEAHLDHAVALHVGAVPEGFFAELGVPFLREYYRAFRDSPHGIALAALVDGVPCGVVVGTVDDWRHYRWILRHRVRSHATAALMGVLRRPGLAVRFLRTRAFRYGRGALRLRARRRHVAASEGPRSTTGVLTHLAVDERHRDNGVERELVDAFVGHARRHGTWTLRVQTRSAGGAAPSFARLGWKPAGRSRNLDGVEFDLLTLGR